MLALLYPICADINCTSFEGADIIVDNTQLIMFGGFAPNSSSADTLSRAMGNRTVQVGTVSKSKNDPSQSLQMASRPLMSADELKALPKGTFIVMKTGQHPMKTRLKLFFAWGIAFGKAYQAEEHGNRAVAYAAKDELLQAIQARYPKPKIQNPDSEIPEARSPSERKIWRCPPSRQSAAGASVCIRARSRTNTAHRSRRCDMGFLDTFYQ